MAGKRITSGLPPVQVVCGALVGGDTESGTVQESPTTGEQGTQAMAAPATPPPPEATLIRLVREAAGLSPEAAAARMETRFSGSRWRQIERGWRRDSDTPVIAPDVTLAQMCFTLGISADRLAETGRTAAVDILREIERSKTPAPVPTPEASEPLAELEEWQQKVILNALDERPRSAREKALLLRTLAEQIEAQSDEKGSSDDPSNDRSPNRSA